MSGLGLHAITWLAVSLAALVTWVATGVALGTWRPWPLVVAALWGSALLVHGLVAREARRRVNGAQGGR